VSCRIPRKTGLHSPRPSVERLRRLCPPRPCCRQGLRRLLSESSPTALPGRQRGDRALRRATRQLRVPPPAPATREDVNRVGEWVGDLRSKEGDPALLQIHERLFHDADLIRKATRQQAGTITLNGVDALRPVAFTGEVTRLDPVPFIARVSLRRTMHVEVLQLLFGEFTEREVQVACRSSNCAGATVGARLLAYCRVGKDARAPDCLLSVSPPEVTVPKMKA